MQPVLHGVTVLDMSRFIAGPYCASLLADFGARVIRVDRVGGSDDRQLLSVTDSGEGTIFLQTNRNKESLTLESSTPEGAKVFRRLVETSDVVVQNLPPRVLRKLGQDYDTLFEINPKIILANITAFGTKGPKCDNLGFDGIGQAASGAVYMGGDPTQPMKAAASYADFGTGLATAFGIMAALMAREKSGRGQLVESSLLGTSLAFFSPYLIEQALASPNRKAQRNRSQLAAPADIFRTRDGWLIVQVLGHGMFTRWARLVGAEALIDDPRFSTDTLRAEQADMLGDLMTKWSHSRSTQEAVDALQRANVPAAEVMSPEQVLRDPHVLASGLLQDMPYPGLVKEAPLAAPPVLLSQTPGSIRTRAPLAGEHTDAVLRGIGYAADDIARLREAGVV